MFNGCKKLKAIDVSHFNTSKCTVMSSLFSQCESLTELNVNSFDMSKVESATFMFGSCTSLERIYCEKDWTSLGNSVLYYAFSNCPSLKGGWGTPYDENYKHHQYARPDGGSNAPGYFWRGGDTGEQPDYHEDIDQVQSGKVQSTKLIRDGMLLIERNGKTYDARGAEVK
jgi:surface protein